MTAKYPTVLDRSFRNFADYGKLSPISSANIFPAIRCKACATQQGHCIPLAESLKLSFGEANKIWFAFCALPVGHKHGSRWFRPCFGTVLTLLM
ncbi:hypothetical protein VTO58DRAFT_100535 [Aureobasidium pullulans]